MERRARIDRRLLACAALALLGCDRPASPLASALERAQPHLAHFGEFDAWARRARQADAALGSRAALDETVFARIRGEPTVIAAWIDLERRSAEHLALPVGVEVPVAASWVPIRTPALGQLRVVVQEPCEVRTRGSESPAAPSCVLIQREQSIGPAEKLVVTVAYGADPAAK